LENRTLLAIEASNVPVRAKASSYPEPFRSRMSGREKKVLGDLFGLTNFGVNLTLLRPNSISSLMHKHSKQDEFIYIVEGRPVLATDQGEIELKPGMCAGFAAGGVAHHLINRSNKDVVYLEIGDRTKGDSACYPNDDIAAVQDSNGSWQYLHKNGTPY
jgi:uncharacterized cupin superfamily protein